MLDLVKIASCSFTHAVAGVEACSLFLLLCVGAELGPVLQF